MRKILLSLAALLFLSANALAGMSIGIKGAVTNLSTDGTETTKSSSEKNTGSEDETVVVPSIFVEFQNDSGISFGIDYVPGEAELGSGTGSNDDNESSGANKASAELAGHATVYALVPVGSNGGYFKGGIASASVDTTETLATGTTYGNEDVLGIMVGVGLQKDGSNGLFMRAEATYTDYEDLNFKGSVDSDSVRNTIDADVDAMAFSLSIGKSF